MRTYNFGDADDVIDPDLIRNVNPAILDAIARYVHTGCPVGDFLTAVIENNLREAVCRADSCNRATLFDIIRVFCNYCPGDCWGSREKRKAWQFKGGLTGLHGIRYTEGQDPSEVAA